MHINGILLTLFLILQGCGDGDSTATLNGAPSGQSQAQSKTEFSLDKALKNKQFEEFYILMSRSTHNMYEYDKGMKVREMYQNPKIDLVAKYLAQIPDNTLQQNYIFREGMESVQFTIPDFIIRRAEGSQEEKIELLKKLQARGLSLKMYYLAYPESVFFLTTDKPPQDAIPYLEMLKKLPQETYGKIVSFLSSASR